MIYRVYGYHQEGDTTLLHSIQQQSAAKGTTTVQSGNITEVC